MRIRMLSVSPLDLKRFFGILRIGLREGMIFLEIK